MDLEFIDQVKVVKLKHDGRIACFRRSKYQVEGVATWRTELSEHSIRMDLSMEVACFYQLSAVLVAQVKP